MIRLKNIKKYYGTRRGDRLILDNVNLTINKGDKLGVLGRNGAGKSTLIRIISGAEQPSSGRIERTMTTSWPIAYTGAFQSALTGFDNLRFICRVYGVDPGDKLDFVLSFSDLGAYLYEPIRHYSAGMRARLAFAISMMIEFDCFLIDEAVSVGDAGFHEKCHTELFVKRADRALVIVSHDAHYVRQHCNRAAVLVRGKLIELASVEEAYEYYFANFDLLAPARA